MRDGVKIYRRTQGLLQLMVCVLLMAGCAVGPDFVRPNPPPVTQYTHGEAPENTVAADGQAQHFEAGAKIAEEWWGLFESPEMDAVVRKAIEENLSLQSAISRLRQSQENLKAGYGVFFPQINASFAAQRQRASPSSTSFSLYTLNGTIAYDLDVFGGERRQVENLAAQAEYQRQTVRAAYLTLIGNVVNVYIAGAAYQAEIQATEEIIAFEKEQLEISEAREKAGIIPYTNVLTLRTQLDATMATLPPLRKNLAQTKHLLTALVGQTPEQWAPPDFDLAKIKLPVEIPLTLPSEFVHQRPDILSSEAQLHSASANIGVATAALFPSLTLNGNYGYNSNDINRVFTPTGNLWSIAANVAASIFHGGTLWFQRKAAIQAYQASLTDYKQAVVTGFQQVADALRGLQFDASTLAAQSQALATADQNLELTNANFKAGLVDYLQVLIADVQYQQAKLNHIQAQASRLQDTTALFVALGGGWWDVSH